MLKEVILIVGNRSLQLGEDLLKLLSLLLRVGNFVENLQSIASRFDHYAGAQDVGGNGISPLPLFPLLPFSQSGTLLHLKTKDLALSPHSFEGDNECVMLFLFKKGFLELSPLFKVSG